MVGVEAVEAAVSHAEAEFIEQGAGDGRVDGGLEVGAQVAEFLDPLEVGLETLDAEIRWRR